MKDRKTIKDYKISIEHKNGETLVEVRGGQLDIGFGLCEVMKRSPDFKELVEIALHTLDVMEQE